MIGQDPRWDAQGKDFKRDVGEIGRDVQKRDGVRAHGKSISQTSHPAHCPLFCPRGERGWGKEKPGDKSLIRDPENR